MKKPIIFLSVFLVLYTLNILFLYKTSGVSLIPAPQEHSQNTMPLLAKSSTFNPIPLALIKDSPTKPNSRYVKPKEGVTPAAIPAPLPPAAQAVTKKEEAPKPEVKHPAPPVNDFTKNTPDFAPNPPEGYVPPVQQAAAPAPVQAEQPKPVVKEEAKPEPKKEEAKVKKAETSPSKYKELVDTASNNPTGKDSAFVLIQESNQQKAAKAKEIKEKTSPKESAEAKKLPAKLPVTKEQPKQQEVKVAPAPVVQEAPKPAPAPAAKPDNSAKLEAADLVDIESLPIQIFLDIRYATTNNFTGKKLYNSSKCYLNKNVAQAFVKAVFYAQAEGLYFRIYDCYRPSSVQQIMWDKEDNGKFLSSPEKGSNHSRGAAIDLGLCDASGKVLPAPTGFDNFTDAAAFNAKEGISEEAIKNRTKLQEIMKKAGFSTIKNEWWHFDYKDAKSYDLLDIAL
jgi:D-alanyl-D-alanine dipeptidase